MNIFPPWMSVYSVHSWWVRYPGELELPMVLSYQCWESSLGPLEEWLVLVTESSLQSLAFCNFLMWFFLPLPWILFHCAEHVISHYDRGLNVLSVIFCYTNFGNFFSLELWITLQFPLNRFLEAFLFFHYKKSIYNIFLCIFTKLPLFL